MRIGKCLYNSNLSLILACLGTSEHHALATCRTLAQENTIKWMNGFVQRGKMMHISLQQAVPCMWLWLLLTHWRGGRVS